MDKTHMKRYDALRPRLVFGLAAAVMTALTIGLMVVVPLQIEDERADHASSAMDARANQAADARTHRQGIPPGSG